MTERGLGNCEEWDYETLEGTGVTKRVWVWMRYRWANGWEQWKQKMRMENGDWMGECEWESPAFFLLCTLSALSVLSPALSFEKLLTVHPRCWRERKQMSWESLLSNKGLIVHNPSPAFSPGSFWETVIFGKPWLAVVDIWEEASPSVRADDNRSNLN